MKISIRLEVSLGNDMDRSKDGYNGDGIRDRRLNDGPELYRVRSRSKSRHGGGRGESGLLRHKSNSRSRNCEATGGNSRSKLYSLWELLLLELDLPCAHHQSVDLDSRDQSYEELINMIKIPFYLENFMTLGLMICFNSFLTLFTLVPLKIVIQLGKSLANISNNQFQLHLRGIKRDLLTCSIIGLSLIILSSSAIDISRMYHDIRGQAHIKLFVMFGVLEVADRLLASLGQDILDILFKLSLNKNTSKFIIFYFLATIYLCFHGYVLIYQTVSLNVAANSYSNALLTLLVSNQFAELKGSVFKRFEREGLFQLTIADLAERYQLSLMMGIIATRNILQLSIDQFGLIPNSWNSWNTWFGVIFGPAFIVIGSEIIVDWLKHCYICKFNKFKPSVYRNFIHVLCLDYLQASKTSSGPFSEPHQVSDYITLMRRIGVPLLASIVCFLGMTIHEIKRVLTGPIFESYWYATLIILVLAVTLFSTLLFIRLILGIIILRLANRIRSSFIAEQALILRKAEKFNHDKTKEYKFASDYNGRRYSVLSGSLPSEYSTRKPNLGLFKEFYTNALIESIYLPGIPNPELSTINPTTRQYIYDVGEKMKANAEESRNKKFAQLDNNEDPLNKVMRYEMASKRIW